MTVTNANETKAQRFMSLWIHGLISNDELEAALRGLR